MYCPNCGKEIPDNSSFCSYCGINLFEENDEYLNDKKEKSKYNKNSNNTKSNRNNKKNTKRPSKHPSKRKNNSQPRQKNKKTRTKTVYKDVEKKKNNIIPILLLLIIIAILLTGIAVGAYIWYNKYYLPNQAETANTTTQSNNLPLDKTTNNITNPDKISNTTEANAIKNEVSSAINSVQNEVSQSIANIATISGKYTGYINSNDNQKTSITCEIVQVAGVVTLISDGNSAAGTYDDKTGELKASLGNSNFDMKFIVKGNSVIGSGTIEKQGTTKSDIYMEKTS